MVDLVFIAVATCLLPVAAWADLQDRNLNDPWGEQNEIRHLAEISCPRAPGQEFHHETQGRHLLVSVCRGYWRVWTWVDGTRFARHTTFWWRSRAVQHVRDTLVRWSTEDQVAGPAHAMAMQLVRRHDGPDGMVRQRR